jgi:hypothetical protein
MATTPGRPPAGNQERIGPSKVYILNSLITSLFFWVVFIVFLVCLFAPWMLTNFDFSPKGDTSEKTLWAGRIALGYITGMLVIFLVGNAVVDYLSIEYVFTMSPRPLFYITTGIFSRSTNTIDPNMVVDCDVHRSPLDLLCDTGELLVKTIDGQFMRMTAVPKVFEVRDRLLSNPPNMRVFNQGLQN